MIEKLRTPALIVIDMQNDFVRKGAALEVTDACATIPAIRALIDAFRQAGNPVIFTRYIADDLYQPLASKFGWINRLAPPVNACVPGFERHYPDIGAKRPVIDMIDELMPLAGETVIDKTYYSAFHRTGLERELARRQVDSVVIAGTVTEMCVEDTARHAVHFGYPTIIVGDAVSSNDPLTHAGTLASFDRNYGWVMRTADVVARLA